MPIKQTHVSETWLQLQNKSIGNVSMFLFNFQMILFRIVEAHMKQCWSHLKVQISNRIAFGFAAIKGSLHACLKDDWCPSSHRLSVPPVQS